MDKKFLYLITAALLFAGGGFIPSAALAVDCSSCSQMALDQCGIDTPTKNQTCFDTEYDNCMDSCCRIIGVRVKLFAQRFILF